MPVMLLAVAMGASADMVKDDDVDSWLPVAVAPIGASADMVEVISLLELLVSGVGVSIALEGMDIVPASVAGAAAASIGIRVSAIGVRGLVTGIAAPVPVGSGGGMMPSMP